MKTWKYQSEPPPLHAPLNVYWLLRLDEWAVLDDPLEVFT